MAKIATLTTTKSKRNLGRVEASATLGICQRLTNGGLVAMTTKAKTTLPTMVTSPPNRMGFEYNKKHLCLCARAYEKWCQPEGVGAPIKGLFTQVPRRIILGSSYPELCIDPAGKACRRVLRVLCLPHTSSTALDQGICTNDER